MTWLCADWHDGGAHRDTAKHGGGKLGREGGNKVAYEIHKLTPGSLVQEARSETAQGGGDSARGGSVAGEKKQKSAGPGMVLGGAARGLRRRAGSGQGPDPASPC